MLLGYSQVTVLPVAQLASVFGVYGVSVLVAAVSAALAYAVGGRRLPPATAAPAYGGLRAARSADLPIVSSLVIAGIARLGQPPRRPRGDGRARASRSASA